MQKEKLVTYLQSLLGSYKEYSGSELYFRCPFCVAQDSKKKLAINLDIGNRATFGHFHCWRDSSHRGSNLFSLVKRMGVSEARIVELRDLTGAKVRLSEIDSIEAKLNSHVYSEVRTYAVELPSEFQPLSDPIDSPHWRNAIDYVHSRGITDYEILRYHIGYCDSGPYNGYVIIPSYGEDMQINYFIARSFYNSPFRYKNPKVSKDVVFNEIHIAWSEPICLVEGVFDAIAIRRNAIPLLGKSVGNAVRKKIYEKGVKSIYICLDNDAMKDSMKYIEEFLRNGINVFFVSLPGKDPSDIGFASMVDIIKAAKQVDFTDLIKMKMYI